MYEVQMVFFSEHSPNINYNIADKKQTCLFQEKSDSEFKTSRRSMENHSMIFFSKSHENWHIRQRGYGVLDEIKKNCKLWHFKHEEIYIQVFTGNKGNFPK